MIDGNARVELYEVGGKEQVQEKFAVIRPHPDDKALIVMDFGGLTPDTVALSADEILTAIAAMKMIADAQ